jgi:hypothetical protein
MNQRKIVIDDTDYFLKPYHAKIKDLCEEEGLKLKADYSIVEGGGKAYSPNIGYGHIQGKISTIWLTYYEDGFELFGEIKIDLETKQLLIEFPYLRVYVQNNI